MICVVEKTTPCPIDEQVELRGIFLKIITQMGCLSFWSNGHYIIYLKKSGNVTREFCKQSSNLCTSAMQLNHQKQKKVKDADNEKCNKKRL